METNTISRQERTTDQKTNHGYHIINIDKFKDHIIKVVETAQFQIPTQSVYKVTVQKEREVVMTLED